MLRDGVRDVVGARARWERAWPTFPLRELDDVADAARDGGTALCRRLVRTLDRQSASGPPRDAGTSALADRDRGRSRHQPARVRAGGARRSGGGRSGAAFLTLRTSPVPSRRCGSGSASRPAPTVSWSPTLWRCVRGVSARCSSATCRRGPSRRRSDPTPCSATPNAVRSTAPAASDCGSPDRTTQRAVSGTCSTRRSPARRHCSRSAGTPPTSAGIRRSRPRSWTRSSTCCPKAPRPAPSRGRWAPPGSTDRSPSRTGNGRWRAPWPGRERRRDPIPPLTDAGVLSELAAREVWSASSLETWLACPVRWFVDRLLQPEDLLPEPEPLGRGKLVHAVLEHVFRALRDARPGPLGSERRDEARRLVHEALEIVGPEHRLSIDPQRDRIARRRVEADLLALVNHLADQGWAYVPTEFELAFGGAKDERPAVQLGAGAAPERAHRPRGCVARGRPRGRHRLQGHDGVRRRGLGA